MKANPLQRDYPSKIALFGLGNAGKTSIIKTLLYEFDAFSSLLPTTGVDRTNIDFLGRELLIWDFGGQSMYRNTYLQKPMMYFQGIRYLYYVIDSQDLKLLDQSVEYFIQIFKNCIEFSEKVQVYLFFHKIDPDYEGEVRFPEVEDRFLSGVLPTMQETKITPAVFHTSIFKPMTVISAFSQPLLGNQTIYDTLCDAIESFCWDHDLSFGMLFVENYEIGSFFKTEKLKEFIDRKIQRYLDWMDDVEEVPEFRIGSYHLHTEQFSIKVGPKVFLFNFAIGYKPLEIDSDIEDVFDDLNDFTDALERILQNAELIRTGELILEEIYDKEKLVEIQQLQKELEDLSELDEEDKQRYIERDRELEVIENQRMKFLEANQSWGGDEEEDADDEDSAESGEDDSDFDEDTFSDEDFEDED